MHIYLIIHIPWLLDIWAMYIYELINIITCIYTAHFELYK